MALWRRRRLRRPGSEDEVGKGRWIGEKVRLALKFYVSNGILLLSIPSLQEPVYPLHVCVVERIEDAEELLKGDGRAPASHQWNWATGDDDDGSGLSCRGGLMRAGGRNLF